MFNFFTFCKTKVFCFGLELLKKKNILKAIGFLLISLYGVCTAAVVYSCVFCIADGTLSVLI